MTSTIFLIISLFLHLFAVILSIKVVHKYENNLKTICIKKLFNFGRFDTSRFWVIILSFIVSFGFFMLSTQLLVAKGVVFSIKYLLLDTGAALLNINYLMLLLLEKRSK